MIKLTWIPNPEADVDYYEVWRASDNVNFTKVADIDNDTGNPSVYDTNTGRFYFEDTSGTDTDWYKIRAVDNVGNMSAFTVSKQAGPPLPAVCVLYGTVLDVNGTPDIDAQVQVFIKNQEQTKDGQFVDSYGVDSVPVEVFTDDVGYWEVEIIRQATVRVVIPKINLDTEIAIPDAASAEITTLL